MDKIVESSNELPNEIKLNSESESNPIFDIISTLQNKLNNKSNDSSNGSNSQNMNKNSESINTETSGFDMSKLSSILSGLGQNKESSGAQGSADILSNLSGLNLDLSTITRFQKIFSKLNQDDPRKKLLTSLKPFLRESRQKNLDTYLILISLADAFDIFGTKDRG